MGARGFGCIVLSSIVSGHDVSLLVPRQHQGVVTGMVFSPDGRRLFSTSSSGSLAVYDSEQQACPVVRLLANVVAKGEEFGPKALNLSEDGKHLLFVGPHPFTITVVDTTMLNEVRNILYCDGVFKITFLQLTSLLSYVTCSLLPFLPSSPFICLPLLPILLSPSPPHSFVSLSSPFLCLFPLLFPPPHSCPSPHSCLSSPLVYGPLPISLFPSPFFFLSSYPDTAGGH